MRATFVVLLSLAWTCCVARPVGAVNIQSHTLRRGIAYIQYPVVVGPKAAMLNPIIQGWVGSNCESLGYGAIPYSPKSHPGVKDCLSALANYCAGPAGGASRAESTCENDITAAAVMNSDGFLVIELDHASHANMEPHGNFVTEYLNLDITNGAILNLPDLLTDHYEETLDEMLVRALRKQWGVPAGKTLTQFGMLTNDPGIPQFAITLAGLMFRYQVGDVGPDAFGDMEVLLPYAELSGVINRKGPLPRLLKSQS